MKTQGPDGSLSCILSSFQLAKSCSNLAMLITMYGKKIRDDRSACQLYYENDFVSTYTNVHTQTYMLTFAYTLKRTYSHTHTLKRPCSQIHTYKSPSLEYILSEQRKLQNIKHKTKIERKKIRDEALLI